MMRSARWAVAHLTFGFAALALLGATRAHAGDGVQFSGDCDRTFVNKQVGANEQWAITWELFSDASGNVFKLDGSPPSFIECLSVGEEGANQIFDCYGSSPCAGPPEQCGGPQWTLIASELSIPTSFFLPPNVDPDDPYSACEVR